MKRFLIIFLLSSCSLFFSCQTLSLSQKHFLENEGAPVALEEISQNINGEFPEHIYIKTNTQTFGFDYEFLLSDGKIYYKSRGDGREKGTGDFVATWQLYLGTGLPFSPKNKWPPVERVVEIGADADCLYAFSDKGILYRSYLKNITSYTQFEWVDYFGWPKKIPLYQTTLLEGKKAWCVGSSRLDVEYYEDALGNEHNYGPLGVESITFLCADGKLHYSDPACPSDFSHSFKTPLNNHFIAENISESASTIFLADAEGHYYTRLVDYNTVGSDPMLYKYSYTEQYSDLQGSNKKSNTTAWMLPNEDWYLQPALPENARGTKYITIIQNGKGNAARELRIAGFDENGRTGYFYKQLMDEEWNFKEVELQLEGGDGVANETFSSNVGAGVSNKTSNSNPRDTVSNKASSSVAALSYTGALWHNGTLVPSSECSVDDFCLSEGPCTLKIGSLEIDFYYSEIWTPFLRLNPGLEAEPVRYFGTAFVDEEALASADNEILSTIFSGKDKKLHQFYIEAFDDYLLIKLEQKKDEYVFYMTKNGKIRFSPQIDRNVFVNGELINEKFEKNGIQTEIKLEQQKKNTCANLNTGIHAGIVFAKILFVDKFSKKVGIITKYTDEITEYNNRFYKENYKLTKKYAKTAGLEFNAKDEEFKTAALEFNANDLLTAAAPEINVNDLLTTPGLEFTPPSPFASAFLVINTTGCPYAVLFEDDKPYLFEFTQNAQELEKMFGEFFQTGKLSAQVKWAGKGGVRGKYAPSQKKCRISLKKSK